MDWIVGKISDLSDSDYNNIYETLSPSRKAHIDKMKVEKARKCSILAVHLINILSKRNNLENLVLETDKQGRPYFSNSSLFISISHSENMVACAISEQPVGIDIEKIKTIENKLIDYVCTESERKFIYSNNEKLNEKFFEVWTAKEALFKKITS